MSVVEDSPFDVAAEVSASRASFRRTVGLIRGDNARLAIVTSLAAATAACGVALLVTSAWLISRASQRPSVVVLGLAIVGVRFFAVARALCRYCERLYGHDSALRALSRLRVRIYERLEVLAPAGLPCFRRGDLLARLVGDVDSLQDLMVRVVPPYGASAVVGVGTAVLTWYILPSAGLVLAATLLGAVVIVPWYTRRLAAGREARQAEVRGELSTNVLDLLQGTQELVAFGATQMQLARVSESDSRLTRLAAASARTAGAGTGLVSLLTGLALWASLLVGVPAVRDGRISGVLLAVIALVPLAVFEVVAPLPGAAQSLEGVRQSAGRLIEVTDALPSLEDPPLAGTVPPGPHRLLLRNLQARYSPRGPWVLDGVDLDLHPGRKVGIVGPSGGGKSTLASVLLRFVPYAGSVTLEGVELSALKGADIRSVVGLCAQDSHVFDTTLRENLLVANRGADEAMLRRVLQRTRLSEWVDQLPAGLDTELGEHGAGMSGGQRQRLAVARCLLADFPVFIFDEPGEHLDVGTADALVADLIEVAYGRTVVMITHRLTGLEAMDEILVLDAGRVVERGTHEALTAAGGYYARQWARECGIDSGRGTAA